MVSPKDPADYRGIRQTVTPTVRYGRAPTSTDTFHPKTGRRYPSTQLWSDSSTNDIWMLAAVVNNLAQWIKISSGSSGPLVQFTVPAGTSPVLPDGDGNVTYTSSGGTITITGSANTINFDLTGGGDAIDSIAVPAGTTPVVPDENGLMTFTVGSGIVITGGTNTMAFTLDGAVVGQTITGDSGGALSPTAGNWNIIGAGNITTSGSGSSLTITDSGTSFQSINVQTFTTSGTYTPTSGMSYCIIEVQGAGGGGGATTATAAGTVSAAAGGGGGGYARGVFDAATVGASQTVTIGAGGAGGTSGGAGSTGGTTSVGSLISGSGGEAGSNAGAFAGTAVQGGSGGGAANGDFQIAGHAGSASLATTAAGNAGAGGASYFGSLRKANTAQSGGGSSAGGAGTNYGGGGAGALTMQSAAAQSGGAGAGGIVVITEFVS